MNITFAADGGRIAEPLGNFLDSRLYVAPGLRSAIENRAFAERGRSHDRPRPGAKILGRNIGSRNLAQIIVDVARVDGVRLAILVLVLQQFLSRQLLAGSNDPGDAAIFQRQRPFLAALAAKLETYLRPFHPGVAIAQGGQAE